MQINDQLTVGAQPTADEIKSLTTDGFQSVVNFRTAGEEDQPLSPDAEREHVEQAGMTYLHVPVSMESMDPGKVDALRDRLESLPKRVSSIARRASGLGR
tara:strand:- start:6505 stop:6804 length:300 start_codon:yes stop_codon:yes gene_type:complete